MALTIRPADIIKAKVIDYLIENYGDVIIGDEVMYGSNHKIVDLLALFKGETYAIEIKSNKDDLRRLPEQITEYSKIFDHTLVFTTVEHLAKVQGLAKTKVSIFEVSDDKVKGRLTTRRNCILKSEMLATMNSAFIRKRLNISNAKNSDSIRKRAMKCKKEYIHSLLYSYFLEKLSAPYMLFLNERSERTEIDDISILSNRLIVD